MISYLYVRMLETLRKGQGVSGSYVLVRTDKGDFFNNTSVEMVPGKLYSVKTGHSGKGLVSVTGPILELHNKKEGA